MVVYPAFSSPDPRLSTVRCARRGTLGYGIDAERFTGSTEATKRERTHFSRVRSRNVRHWYDRYL